MKTIANTPLPSAVRQPDYDRRALRSRIVHLGFGAFHRAHQALLTDRLLSAQGGDWGICEISLSGGVPLFEALRQQDHLYSVLEKGADGHQAIVVGAVHESLHRKLEGITAVLEKLAEPQVAIVSMTITEKAIASSPAAGGWIDSIRGSSPIWRGRISRRPCPAFWWKRCGCGANAACPPSLLSCDNIPENGHVLRRAVLDLAQARDPALADWIATAATFPAPWWIASCRPPRRPRWMRSPPRWAACATNAPSPASPSSNGWWKTTLPPDARRGSRLASNWSAMYCRLNT